MTTQLDTTMARAAEHYQQMLAEAKADPVLPAPVLIPLDAPSDASTLEVCNVEVGDCFEAAEIGPYAGNRYTRIRARDLLLYAYEQRRLADDLITAVLDERDRKAEADRHDCICGVRLDPDDAHCGAERCRRHVEREAAYESLGLL